MERLTFEERNRDSYIKQENVPSGIVEKYTGVLPDELIAIWKTMGFGIFENGFIQLINPDEYEFAFEYIDKLLEPSIIFGYTAMGDLLLWEGNKGWTISADEGNRVKIINIRKCKSRALNSFKGTVDAFLDEYFISHKDYFDSKDYLEARETLPKLEYGQCYGYVPALSLGGKASNKNLQVVDTKSYIEIVGQSVGKIIDLG
ncbi:GAD-like domain-containing protein [Chryseobacterium sp. CBSDS_008]|uniref:GAD-like domain-containing protein n=1 Tax=Chryseobacterium sp. CBSDS_008 TaxID=3415265 RepID=UPI003CFADD54